MKTLIATLLATAVSASFAQAPEVKPDPAAYRNMTQKAAADYKAAEKNCRAMSGNARTVCTEEAKVARARAEHEAVAQYNNTTKANIDARTKLANAEYGLAKARCAASTGAEKDSCVNNAKSVHTAALADAKLNAVSTTTASVASPVTGTTTADATKAAAVEKCAQVAGQPTTGCLIDNSTAAATTGGAAAGATTGAATATTTTPATTTAGAIANRTESAAATAVEKTKDAAATVADKTERAVDTIAAKTERAAETVAAKSERAAEKTGSVVADSVITTKVKADIFKEPELKSMAIHVETDKGVVMLSGFVDSKADAEKAAEIARKVEGVTQVKSAIKVK